MIKQSKVEIANLDKVEYYDVYQRICKHIDNPNFFTEAVKKYRYYRNPVAYLENDSYRIILGYGSVEALRASNVDTITLDVVELNADERMEFLLAFQYREHKQERAMAEVVKIIIDYIGTKNGKSWIRKITPSNDKEDRIATVTGNSKHAAKCYIKLTEHGNAEFLKMLTGKDKCSLSQAYDKCVEHGKLKQAAVKNSGKPASSEASCEPAGTNPQVDSPSSSSVGNMSNVLSAPNSPGLEALMQAAGTDVNKVISAVNVPGMRAINQAEGIDTDEAEDEEPAEIPHPYLLPVKKAILIMEDGKQLEIVGEFQLSVDQQNITSTQQLQQLPDGNWRLPQNHKSFFLQANFKAVEADGGNSEFDDFFSDFA